MIEKSISLSDYDPTTVYGSGNKFFKIIENHFKGLKLTARGHELKVFGPSQEITRFEDKIMHILEHIHKYNSLTENQLERLLEADEEEKRAMLSGKGDENLVYGINGQVIKARTANQRKLVAAVDKHDMVFVIGPAGTGKTYTAVALAVRALKNKEVKRIVLTRPAVEAGENLGFLPGDLKEKLDPYLQPLYDGLRDMIAPEKLAYYMETGIIQIAPLAFMRGRTLDHAFVILDEAQNTTHAQMKMFLTRMGKSAKFVITGDASQIDLPRNQTSGLKEAIKIVDRIPEIGVVRLDDKDVIRHSLVKTIINAYKNFEDNKNGIHPDENKF